MQVQVNTGNGVANKDALERWATDFLQESLGRFAQEITRVELQLNDESRARQSGPDMHCMLEARITGREPVAVHHRGQTQDEAIRGAVQRLNNALDHTLGKLDRTHRGRDTIRRASDAVG
jgi:hypothetical protein